MPSTLPTAVRALLVPAIFLVPLAVAIAPPASAGNCLGPEAQIVTPQPVFVTGVTTLSYTVHLCAIDAFAVDLTDPFGTLVSTDGPYASFCGLHLNQNGAFSTWSVALPYAGPVTMTLKAIDCAGNPVQDQVKFILTQLP